MDPQGNCAWWFGVVWRRRDADAGICPASSYFAGTAVDNGVTFRKTNFAKIDKKWHRQVVKYFSSEPLGTVVVDTATTFST